ncbi:hypothetical protein MHIB_18090 [Mycolicibacter hiberniae]|uniref:Uncharacterized protein n=1 Tax=Mycolicibacter hiberniae TaxID=29314 RepID=A0A7I7X3S7_9MYCO|nr:hypothetical protein MHIB_18090 [Mycolicibacter hiberniae]
MQKATSGLGAVLLVTAGGLLCGQPTALAEPEPSTESSAESAAPSPTPSPAASPTPSPAATPTENASEPSAEAPKLGVAGGHEVTYTITATSDLTGNISYIKTDPPSMAAYNANSAEYLETVRVPIAGGEPVVYTTTLADPAQWALVTASGGLRINPEFHCEIAVDGEVVVSQQGGSGVSCATRPW